MPVKLIDWRPTASAADTMNSVERPWAGFCERLAYQAMDSVLRDGWTPERAAHIYGGMSEGAMREAVVYARRHGFLK